MSFQALDPDVVRRASSAYTRPPNFHPSYGTAGFRADASLLSSTVFRCGLLAAARAILLNGHTGLMITASHNPIGDNGVKMVDPDGGMMPQSFEAVAAELANCDDDNAVVAVLRDRVLGGQTARSSPQTLAVLIGHDTRPSAPELLAAALAGVRALNVHACCYGCVTTPQLHFLVAVANRVAPPPQCAPDPDPVLPGLEAYFDAILGAFSQLTLPQQQQQQQQDAAPSAAGDVLFVDCANGVGAQQLQRLVPELQRIGVQLQLRNTGGAESGGSGGGLLNHRCGADFVQKDRLPPTDFGDVPPGSRCCSIDGDADRLVYFSPTGGGGGGDAAAAAAAGGICLLDGDKVAMLAAVYIRDIMNQLPPELLQGVEVCCVQTAYANGAATSYLRDVLRLPIVCTNTGVKYLHEAAHSADLGVYFESNGHGTVLFSEKLLQRLREAPDSPAAGELLLLSRLINQTVGDAISGVLLVELILSRKGWSLRDWAALYADLPSRQLKVRVADRGCITTQDAERVCVTPAGLQAAIQAAVEQLQCGRAFARPSGTEDAVRVYAEAESQEAADALALQVARLVYDLAGGVGPRP